MPSGWTYQRYTGESDDFLSDQTGCPAWAYIGGTEELYRSDQEVPDIYLQQASQTQTQNVEFHVCNAIVVRMALLRPAHAGHELLRGTLQYMNSDGYWVGVAAGAALATLNGNALQMLYDGHAVSKRWRIHDWRTENNQWLAGVELLVSGAPLLWSSGEGEGGYPFKRLHAGKPPTPPDR